jgi:hypothetical protein
MHNLNDEVKKDEMGREWNTNAEKKKAYRMLMSKSEGRRSLGRPRRRWVDYITVDLRETGWGDVDWIDLVQDRDRWRALVNTVMNHQVPQNVGKFLIR